MATVSAREFREAAREASKDAAKKAMSGVDSGNDGSKDSPATPAPPQAPRPILRPNRLLAKAAPKSAGLIGRFRRDVQDATQKSGAKSAELEGRLFSLMDEYGLQYTKACASIDASAGGDGAGKDSDTMTNSQSSPLRVGGGDAASMGFSPSTASAGAPSPSGAEAASSSLPFPLPTTDPYETTARFKTWRSQVIDKEVDLDNRLPKLWVSAERIHQEVDESLTTIGGVESVHSLINLCILQRLGSLRCHRSMALPVALHPLRAVM
jgi:hypothetical protein